MLALAWYLVMAVPSLMQDAERATNWPDAAVKIIQVISAIILAYLAYLQKRNGEQQIITVRAAGVAAKAAQNIAATVVHDGAKRDEVIEKIHVAVNSAKTELERQNLALVKLAESTGVEVPAELRARDPGTGTIQAVPLKEKDKS